MPRVTVRNARTETLRGTLETELGRWGHEGPPKRFKPLFAEIEAELKYRDEQLEHQPWRFAASQNSAESDPSVMPYEAGG